MDNRNELAYCGHPSQLYSVEQFTMNYGYANGVRILEVKNGLGLNFTILLDRGMGISRLSNRGINCSFLSASGIRNPQFYDRSDEGFLRSFHAGFLTTCGLFNVGVSSDDDGEKTVVHGDIDNTPCEQHSWYVEGDFLHIKGLIRSERIFYHKLVLERHFKVSLISNEFFIEDTIHNTGSTKCPLMLLYHMNMGYPLLDEDAELFINSTKITPRTELAKVDEANWNKLQKPEHNYVERCYYHGFTKGNQSSTEDAVAAIYQKKQEIGLAILFDSAKLDHFTQWKQMGYRDYALGLEPGNAHCDGRDIMRKTGELKFLDVGETTVYGVHVKLLHGRNEFDALKNSYKKD